MEEEVVREDYEEAEEPVEVVVDIEETLEPEEVIAKPRPRISKSYLVKEAEHWWFLPNSLEGLEKLAKNWGRYAQCLIELRWKLRKQGLLYPELERDLAREINAERAKLYVLGLRALELAGSCSSIDSEELRRLCEYASAGPPRYVWEVITSGASGAKRPDIILSYMCKYKRECC